MTLRFRLRGLAETLIEEASCPCCSCSGADDNLFSTEHTKVTFEGIVVVLQCKNCDEIFIPDNQKLGIVDETELKVAVEKDHQRTGEALYADIRAVMMDTEKLNACRKGLIH